jgi:hypothetical protein
MDNHYHLKDSGHLVENDPHHLPLIPKHHSPSKFGCHGQIPAILPPYLLFDHWDQKQPEN